MKTHTAMAVLVAILALGIPTAHGADKGGLKDRPSSTIFDDYEKPAPKTQTTAFSYVGVTVGEGTAHLKFEDLKDTDHSFVAGGYVGYWIRPSNGPFGVGVEGDFMWQDFKFVNPDDKTRKDTDRSQWNATARGRVGTYLTDYLIAYGTAGVAFTDVANPGPVYGGGLELIGSAFGIRAEVLRYDFSGDGADQTVGRVGMTFRLN